MGETGDDSAARTPDAVVARLRCPEEARQATITRLRGDVALGRLEPTVLADAAVLVLETLTDADGWLDIAAAALVAEFGDVRHVSRLRAARRGLRPRVALRDWRFEVDRAIDVLAERARVGCDCAAEAAHGAVPRGPRWETEGEPTSPEPYLTRSVVRCTTCGRRWVVIEEEGYHYPVFRWTV